MEKADSGRFCVSCQKKVIDFTGLSDAEIFRIFGQSPGKVCGHFNPSQLNRVIANTASRKHIALPAALTALLLASNLFTSLVSASSTAAHTPVNIAAVNVSRNDAGHDSIQFISGKVTDIESGDLLPAVIVSIKGTRRAVLTDANGRFHMEIPDSLQQQPLVLECSFVGYERLERKINMVESGNIELALRTEAGLLGDVVVTCRAKATFKERMIARWKSIWK
jgi:hypothetical protein